MPSTHNPLSTLADYQHWLSTIKQRVVSARLRVALAGFHPKTYAAAAPCFTSTAPRNVATGRCPIEWGHLR